MKYIYKLYSILQKNEITNFAKDSTMNWVQHPTCKQ